MSNLLQHLNWADYFIIAVLVISTLISLIRGFIREVLSIVAWVVAFIVALKFSPKLALVFVGYIKNPSLRLVLAFGILFLVTLILAGLLSFLLSQLIVKTGLSGTDRVLGMVFGFIRGALVVAVILLLVTLDTKQKTPELLKSSLLAGHFHWLVSWLRGFLPVKATAKGLTTIAKSVIVTKVAT